MRLSFLEFNVNFILVLINVFFLLLMDFIFKIEMTRNNERGKETTTFDITPDLLLLMLFPLMLLVLVGTVKFALL